MPAVLHFYLICNDCYFQFHTVGTKNLILTSSITNFLLIAKYLLNPLIYASRMHEIRVSMFQVNFLLSCLRTPSKFYTIKLQTATRQMNAECRRKLCHFGSLDTFEHTGNSLTEGSQRFSVLSSSSRRNNVSLNTIQLRNGFSKTMKRAEATDL